MCDIDDDEKNRQWDFFLLWIEMEVYEMRISTSNRQIMARFNEHSYAVLKLIITNLNAFNIEPRI